MATTDHSGHSRPDPDDLPDGSQNAAQPSQNGEDTASGGNPDSGQSDNMAPPGDVDPEDGTDSDDDPVDNPSG